MANQVSICVIRGSGKCQGEDITDPLIINEVIALERARQELNDNAHSLQNVAIVIPYTTGLRIGGLIEILDSFQGASYKARIVSISHRSVIDGDTGSEGNPERITEITVEKPTDFYKCL